MPAFWPLMTSPASPSSAARPRVAPSVRITVKNGMSQKIGER